MLSVIIPTYQRVHSLQVTLQSLAKQNFDNFELLVVDNAGEDSVKKLVDTMSKNRSFKVKYLRHTAGGSTGARMRGVKESIGDLLVFTDDDLTFHEDWLKNYAQAFKEHPSMVAAGGKVKPVWEISPQEWLLDYMGDSEQCPVYALMDCGDEFRVSNQEAFYSCNMAIKREIFNWTGLRPELFGKKTIGNGESGLNKELSEKNQQIGYVPGACVYHHISKERMSVEYIRKWAWHLGGAQMFTRWNGKERHITTLLKELLWISKGHYKEWIMYAFFRDKTSQKAIDTQYRASLGLCKLFYLWWMYSDSLVKECLDMEDFSI